MPLMGVGDQIKCPLEIHENSTNFSAIVMTKLELYSIKQRENGVREAKALTET